MKKIMTRLLSLALICAFVPSFVLADTWDLEKGDITVNATDTSQTVTQVNGEAKVDASPVITSNGTATDHTITINAASGAKANVTLENVNIDVSNEGKAAITAQGSGNVNIELNGTNTVVSGKAHAGVEKNNEGNLTIADQNKDGSLNATGGKHGAGIGGGGEGAGTDITVSGGKVNATGGEGGAGIGGGSQGDGSSITIENGEVKATGGESGAGIGGGWQGAGSGITVKNGKVNATGGENGAGIGGGYQDDGSGITVKNGTVNATGGKYSAGIGGGNLGDGTNITVNNGEVKATGGDGGAGIGGGAEGSGSEIAVSGDAQVTVQGGKVGIGAGTGAGIGSGGKWKQNGEELSMDPDKLNEGTIRYYAPGANMQTNAPTKILYNTKAEHNWDGGKVTTPATCTKPGVRTYTCQTNPAHTKTEEIPALGHQFETYVYNNDATCEADGTETALCAHPGCNETDTRTAPGTQLHRDVQPVLYRVTDGSGKDIPCQAEQKESVLTVTVKDAAFAILTGSLRGIGILRQQGVETIRFVTKDAVSTFRLDKLLQQGGNSDTYTLTHDGKTVTFTCKDRDIQKILEG